MPRQWTLAPLAPESLFAAMPDVPRCIVQTLYNRNVTSPSAMRDFLAVDAPDARGDFSTLPDMTKAVARITRAIDDAEKIIVYSDFDVDGICAAAVLMNMLGRAGAQAQIYIPRRDSEGYGLNSAAIRSLHAGGAGLLIAADCGTSSLAEIALANELGMDVIVADHHDASRGLPPALAVINPTRLDSVYPYRDLAAVGVAYRLAQAMEGQDATADIDLVALGTVVDVAPLIGENRSLVRQGLKAMKDSPRSGLRALLAAARTSADTVSAGVLAFALGPRLNAAGRLDTAHTSYDLLMARSMDEAAPLAQKLEEQNLERQALLETALQSARPQAAEQAAASPLLFVDSEAYRSGIIGLVAGRLVEEFGRPAVVVERGEALSRGSCRSIRGFHMAYALTQCSDLLERSGGHAMAAGFTVRTQLLSRLKERLVELAGAGLTETELPPPLLVDSVIPLNDAGWDLLKWLKRMAPFGMGNPAPLLRSDAVSIRDIRLLRNGHVRLNLRCEAITWPAIAFRQAALAESLKAGDVVDIAYNLEDRFWNGEELLQLEIKDIRKHEGRA
jgi:single-stranded-DNA-specific exonuclease